MSKTEPSSNDLSEAKQAPKNTDEGAQQCEEEIENVICDDDFKLAFQTALRFTTFMTEIEIEEVFEIFKSSLDEILAFRNE